MKYALAPSALAFLCKVHTRNRLSRAIIILDIGHASATVGLFLGYWSGIHKKNRFAPGACVKELHIALVL